MVLLLDKGKDSHLKQAVGALQRLAATHGFVDAHADLELLEALGVPGLPLVDDGQVEVGLSTHHVQLRALGFGLVYG